MGVQRNKAGLSIDVVPHIKYIYFSQEYEINPSQQICDGIVVNFNT